MEPYWKALTWCAGLERAYAEPGLTIGGLADSISRGPGTEQEMRHLVDKEYLATQRLRACGKPVSVEHPRPCNKEAAMRFLTGSKIQQEVRNIMSRPGEVMAAVPYTLR